MSLGKFVSRIVTRWSVEEKTHLLTREMWACCFVLALSAQNRADFRGLWGWSGMMGCPITERALSNFYQGIARDGYRCRLCH